MQLCFSVLSQQVDLELVQLGVQRGRGAHHLRKRHRSQVGIVRKRERRIELFSLSLCGDGRER